MTTIQDIRADLEVARWYSPGGIAFVLVYETDYDELDRPYEDGDVIITTSAPYMWRQDTYSELPGSLAHIADHAEDSEELAKAVRKHCERGGWSVWEGTIRGNSQGDWQDVLVATRRGDAERLAEMIEDYTYGRVYRIETWAPYSVVIDGETYISWEYCDSIGGLYLGRYRNTVEQIAEFVDLLDLDEYVSQTATILAPTTGTLCAEVA